MYCSKCGAAIAGGGSFCSNCGQATYTPPTPAALIPVAGAAFPHPQLAGQMPAYIYTPPVAYAGFWIRFVAYLIDALVVGVVFAGILIPLLFLTGLGAAINHNRPFEDGDVGAAIGFTIIAALIGVGFIGAWVYHAYMESSEWQATLGKRALGLVVTDMNGGRVSFGRASGRHFSKILSGMIPLGIGYIVAGFTEKKQAVHDMIASCVILRKS